MRISDWSSDVCSSDLAFRRVFHCIPDAIGGVANGLGRSHNSVGFACLILIVDEQDISGDSNDRDKDDGENYTPAASPAFNDGGGGSLYHPFGYPFVSHVPLQIGRASCRERVCPYV